MDSINYLSCEFGIEFEIALYTNGGESNFNKPFLHFNVKKKYIYIYIYPKLILNLTVNIEY